MTTVGQEAIQSFGELSGKKSSQPIDGSSKSGFFSALPFIGATILVAALPLLLFLLFHTRAQKFMPKVRDWMNANSWLVNIIVCGVFILLIVL